MGGTIPRRGQARFAVYRLGMSLSVPCRERKAAIGQPCTKHGRDGQRHERAPHRTRRTDAMMRHEMNRAFERRAPRVVAQLGPEAAAALEHQIEIQRRLIELTEKSLTDQPSTT